MAKNKRSAKLLPLVIFFFLLTVVLTTILVILILSENSKLQEQIGPPASGLPVYTRISLSYHLIGAIDQLQSPILIYQSPSFLEINPGDSPTQICRKLSAISQLSDCTLFVDYLIYKGLDREILAGKFSIPNGTSMVSLAELIADPAALTIRFSLLPGWRVEEVAHSLSLSGVLDKPELLVELVKQNQLEGYLYPGEYDLNRDSSPAKLVDTFTARFETLVTADVIHGFESQGLSTHEAVILASIVEKEAIHKEEMPAIASVYLNRLRIPMKLDADPTVQYALGYIDNSWWKSPLSLNDLQVSSPYNTYRHEGFPPGPIANPGLSALRAVAFPDSTDYLYFRSSCDNSGYHVFSRNYNEHLQNECP